MQDLELVHETTRTNLTRPPSRNPARKRGSKTIPPHNAPYKLQKGFLITDQLGNLRTVSPAETFQQIEIGSETNQCTRDSPLNIGTINVDDHDDDALSYINCNFTHDCPDFSKMFPTTIDQNRPESLHPYQTVHVHMHQLCACMHPYYSGYRAPIMTPYHVPVPRPYNLQHYQYTQYNLNPYNFPAVHPNVAAAIGQQTSANMHQAAVSVLDFGPSSRDQHNFEAADEALSGLTDAAQDIQETRSLTATIENFTKFLEQGCTIAEKIAIRNQHRPCFKNIQNLCNRTRSEILKSSNTVSNIHSQGIPWATKDFIYAFVRLINCWHMLRGYLESKDGTLCSIDRELTGEFKSCYLAWEKNTKDLAGHMIRIFTNLDNNVSNPNAMIHKAKSATSQEGSKKLDVSPQNAAVRRAENILHVSSTTPEFTAETVVLSDSSETSPRGEDSDNENCVYMKPGSYNVPKRNNGSSNSSQPSIEFFETAQNVSAHYKKISNKKHEAISITTDKMWRDAQTAVPYLINKMTPTQMENSSELEENAVKYFVDLNKREQSFDIQEWLNNNRFFENQNEVSAKPIAVLQRSALPKLIKINNDQNFGGSLKDVWPQRRAPPSRNYQKMRNNAMEKIHPKCGVWEYEKVGGLTANATVAVADILMNLDKEEFAKHINYYNSDDKDERELESPTSLSSVKKKLAARKYHYLQEFVHDLRNLISCAVIYYENRFDVTEQISSFEEKFEELLSDAFPNLDFSNITGEPHEEMGQVSSSKPKQSDGDGDH